MPTSVGPNTFGEENLVFGYDLGDTVNSYRGEPTVNYITTMAANLGGNVSLSYPNNVYICTAQETNVIDPNARGGQYSRFTGNTDSDNNQLFTSFVDGSVNARNTTVAYSVYLKGTGTCHLTVYSDIAGYSTTPTINLTGEWTRYSIVQAVGNYTTYAWSAVRGILTSTNVYVAAQQVEFKSHVTPFINGTRSATQGLIDLTGTSTIDLTNVSFDSDAQMTFDGTDDSISIPHANSPITNLTYELVVRIDSIPASNTFRSIWQKSANWNGDTGISMQMIYGNLTFSYGNNWGGTVQYPLSNLTAGNRYHIVGTADSTSGADVRFYINGVLVDTGTSYQTPTTTSNLTIGLGNGGTLDGKIDVFKMYSRTLTAQEVASNYNAIKSRFSI